MTTNTKQTAEDLLASLRAPPTNARGDKMDSHGWHALFGLSGLAARECMDLAIEIEDANPKASDQLLELCAEAGRLIGALKKDRSFASFPEHQLAFRVFTDKYARWYVTTFEA